MTRPEEDGGAANELYQYCKDQQEKEKEKLADMPQQSQGGGSTGNSDSSEESESEGDATEGFLLVNKNPPKRTVSWEWSTERFDEEPEVKTADSLESNLKDLINSNAVSNTYVNSSVES